LFLLGFGGFLGRTWRVARDPGAGGAVLPVAVLTGAVLTGAVLLGAVLPGAVVLGAVVPVGADILGVVTIIKYIGQHIVHYLPKHKYSSIVLQRR
jgi:hypothetical protein